MIDAVTGLISGTIGTGASADSPYQVTVSVTDATAPDNPGTAEFSWIIDNEGKPAAIANATPLEGEAPLKVDFDGSDSADDQGITAYIWDFGDGSPNGSGAAVSHTYTEVGVYTATLTVEDAQGQTSTDTVEITVGDATGPGGNPTVADNILVLYPNPASSQITLGFANDVVLEVIQIFDRGGRLMKDLNPNIAFSDGQYIIDVSMLSEGLYFIHSVDNNGRKFTKQMVIKR